jgi:hypothetical protein
MKEFKTALQAIGWVFSEQDLPSYKYKNEKIQIKQDRDRNQWIVVRTIEDKTDGKPTQ